MKFPSFGRKGGLLFAGFLALLSCFILSACTAKEVPEETSGPVNIPPTSKSAKTESSSGGLSRQVRMMEEKVRRLEAVASRLSPAGPVIMIDTAQGRIRLMVGTRVAAEGPCSTGSGLELADSAGERSWTFDTPRGSFRVISKVSNPVWYRPDWSYIEEGEPIPRNRSQRAEANVLGDYAIAFGNGYFIHGTLYTRLLGSNVTHGCIRVDDKVLKKLYNAAQPGTPIWIY